MQKAYNFTFDIDMTAVIIDNLVSAGRNDVEEDDTVNESELAQNTLIFQSLLNSIGKDPVENGEDHLEEEV